MTEPGATVAAQAGGICGCHSSGGCTFVREKQYPDPGTSPSGAAASQGGRVSWQRKAGIAPGLMAARKETAGGYGFVVEEVGPEALRTKNPALNF